MLGRPGPRISNSLNVTPSLLQVFYISTVWLVFGSATEIAFSAMPKVLVLSYSTYGRGELVEQRRRSRLAGMFQFVDLTGWNRDRPSQSRFHEHGLPAEERNICSIMVSQIDHNSSRPRDFTASDRRKTWSEAIDTAVGPKRSKTETIMPQSDDAGTTPLLDFEAWRALLRSNCGRDVEVTAPERLCRLDASLQCMRA